MKNFSMVGKLVIFSFLVVFLMAVSYQPVFAASEEAVVSKNHLKLSIGAGLTFGTESFIAKSGQESFSFTAAFEPDLGGCGNDPSKIGPKRKWPRINFAIEMGYNTKKMNSVMNGFKEPLGTNAFNEKFYWLSANPTIRLTFGKSNLQPFIKGGPGIYFPKRGKARLGFKGGVGLGLHLSKPFIIEIGGDYHYIFLKEGNVWGKSTDFFNVYGGIGIIL
jgi:hypothetical protein